MENPHKNGIEKLESLLQEIAEFTTKNEVSENQIEQFRNMENQIKHFLNFFYCQTEAKQRTIIFTLNHGLTDIEEIFKGVKNDFQIIRMLKKTIQDEKQRLQEIENNN